MSRSLSHWRSTQRVCASVWHLGQWRFRQDAYWTATAPQASHRDARMPCSHASFGSVVLLHRAH